MRNMSQRVLLLFSYFFAKSVLINQKRLMRAPLRAQSRANCNAQKRPQAKSNFTVFSLSVYINAQTVIIAAIIQKNCHSI